MWTIPKKCVKDDAIKNPFFYFTKKNKVSCVINGWMQLSSGQFVSPSFQREGKVNIGGNFFSPEKATNREGKGREGKGRGASLGYGLGVSMSGFLNSGLKSYPALV
jgi:hypothetical protein